MMEIARKEIPYQGHSINSLRIFLKALLILFLLIFTSPMPTFGQGGADPVIPPDFPPEEHRFDNLTMEDGLSQSSVFAIPQDEVVFDIRHKMAAGQDEIVFDQIRVGWIGAFGQGFIQDQDGFFWIGTLGALYKWNGIGLVSYTSVNSGLSDGMITAILEDKGGIIWVGTLDGLNKYDKNTDLFTSYKHDPDDPNTISHNTIGSQVQPQTLLEDSSGVIWIGTQNGLNKYNKDSNTFTHYLKDASNDTSISHNVVSAIYEDRSNVLWIGTQGGLNKFDKETGKFTHYLHDPDDPTSISGDRVMAIFRDREGTLWIGIEGGGLNKFDRETGRFTRYQHHPDEPQSIITNNVNAIVEDANGNLWLSHYPDVAGISLFDKKDETFTNIRSDPKDPLGLSSDNINDIYQDKYGVIWAIDVAGTVNRFDKNVSKIMTFRHSPDDPNTLSSSNVYPLYEDRNGTMWAGTKEEFGLNEYVRETKSFIRHPVANVYSIYEGSAGDFWVGTVAGKLHEYDRATRQIVETYEVSTSFVTAIIEDPSEADVLWIATHKDGLVKFHKPSGDITYYRHNPEEPDSIGANSVWSIHPESKDSFWLGTFGAGINKFDKIAGTFSRYEHDSDDPHSISHNVAANMALTASGEIWIITQGGGLNRFNTATGHFEHYTYQDGNFPTNNLSAILEDNEGQLWISSNELGIIKFNPMSKAYKIYAESEGTQDGIFWFVGRAKSRTGELWFGGSEGLSVVQPERMTLNQFVPPIFLTSITQGGVPLEIGIAPERLDEIILDWREPYFEFEFVALNYVSSRENQYAYMLEGIDQDWYYAGTNPSARYSGLSSGEYRLKLKGSNNDGVWNEEGTSIHVTIEPPWWGTWWFRGGTLVLLVGLLAGGFVWQRETSRRREGQLEVTVVERTKELGERVKELNCLYGISRLASRQDTTIEEILAGTVSLLPGAFHYSGIACARIVLDDEEYKSDRFQETPWNLTAAITMQGVQAGIVEVRYLEERPDVSEGPFQEEERHLLDAIAERLGRIIERMRVQQEVAFERELTQSILDTSLDVIVVFDAHTLQYVKWNRASTRITGYSDEEISNMHPIEDFFDEEEAPQVRAAFEELMREGTVTATVTHINKDGTRFPFDYTGAVIKDDEGNDQYYVFIGRDITERMEAEEALKASEEQYRDLVEKINEVIYSLDDSGVITYISPAIEEVLGYSPDQLIGESFDRFILPEDIDRARENISNLIGGGTARVSDYRAENSSGEVRWIRVSSLPIMDEDRVSGFQGVLTDITAIKRVEKQLERAAALAERQRLARELHDSVTQTLYGIDLFSNATWTALSTDKVEKAMENVQQIQKLSKSALSDMRLLIFELQPQILEEKGLAAALKDRLDMVESRSGLNTSIRVVDERPLDTSIEIELYAIANESLNNALKHSKAEQVTVILEYTVDSVCLQVWDDGIGFDQSDPDLSKGFGLRNIEERASRMGGSFSLDSSAGAGTVVEVEVAA